LDADREKNHPDGSTAVPLANHGIPGRQAGIAQGEIHMPKEGAHMNLKAITCFAVVTTLSYSLSTEAAVTTSKKSVPTPAVKSEAVPPAGGQMSPVKQSPDKTVTQRATFNMTCPDGPEVTLNISYTMGGWGLNPSQLRPTSFTRAYATIDAADSSKVILACLYYVTADYLAKTYYNGLQKCICNESTGEGKVGYTGPAGFTMNVAGTTAHGKLPVKKTGQQVKDQTLECQFHADGQAQFFKKFQAPGRLLNCSATGRDVSCQY
jgi:hypothetical protein